MPVSTSSASLSSVNEKLLELKKRIDELSANVLNDGLIKVQNAVDELTIQLQSQKELTNDVDENVAKLMDKIYNLEKEFGVVKSNSISSEKIEKIEKDVELVTVDANEISEKMTKLASTEDVKAVAEELHEVRGAMKKELLEELAEKLKDSTLSSAELELIKSSISEIRSTFTNKVDELEKKLEDLIGEKAKEYEEKFNEIREKFSNARLENLSKEVIEDIKSGISENSDKPSDDSITKKLSELYSKLADEQEKREALNKKLEETLANFGAKIDEKNENVDITLKSLQDMVSGLNTTNTVSTRAATTTQDGEGATISNLLTNNFTTMQALASYACGLQSARIAERVADSVTTVSATETSTSVTGVLHTYPGVIEISKKADVYRDLGTTIRDAWMDTEGVIYVDAAYEWIVDAENDDSLVGKSVTIGANTYTIEKRATLKRVKVGDAEQTSVSNETYFAKNDKELQVYGLSDIASYSDTNQAKILDIVIPKYVIDYKIRGSNNDDKTADGIEGSTKPTDNDKLDTFHAYRIKTFFPYQKNASFYNNSYIHSIDLSYIEYLDGVDNLFANLINLTTVEMPKCNMIRDCDKFMAGMGFSSPHYLKVPVNCAFRAYVNTEEYIKALAVEEIRTKIYQMFFSDLASSTSANIEINRNTLTGMNSDLLIYKNVQPNWYTISLGNIIEKNGTVEKESDLAFGFPHKIENGEPYNYASVTYNDEPYILGEVQNSIYGSILSSTSVLDMKNVIRLSNDTMTSAVIQTAAPAKLAEVKIGEGSLEHTYYTAWKGNDVAVYSALDTSVDPPVNVDINSEITEDKTLIVQVLTRAYGSPASTDIKLLGIREGDEITNPKPFTYNSSIATITRTGSSATDSASATFNTSETTETPYTLNNNVINKSFSQYRHGEPYRAMAPNYNQQAYKTLNARNEIWQLPSNYTLTSATDFYYPADESIYNDLINIINQRNYGFLTDKMMVNFQWLRRSSSSTTNEGAYSTSIPLTVSTNKDRIAAGIKRLDKLIEIREFIERHNNENGDVLDATKKNYFYTSGEHNAMEFIVDILGILVGDDESETPGLLDSKLATKVKEYVTNNYDTDPYTVNFNNSHAISHWFWMSLSTDTLAEGKLAPAEMTAYNNAFGSWEKAEEYNAIKYALAYFNTAYSAYMNGNDITKPAYRLLQHIQNYLTYLKESLAWEGAMLLHNPTNSDIYAKMGTTDYETNKGNGVFSDNDITSYPTSHASVVLGSFPVIDIMNMKTADDTTKKEEKWNASVAENNMLIANTVIGSTSDLTNYHKMLYQSYNKAFTISYMYNELMFAMEELFNFMKVELVNEFVATVLNNERIQWKSANTNNGVYERIVFSSKMNDMVSDLLLLLFNNDITLRVNDPKYDEDSDEADQDTYLLNTTRIIEDLKALLSNTEDGDWLKTWSAFASETEAFSRNDSTSTKISTLLGSIRDALNGKLQRYSNINADTGILESSPVNNATVNSVQNPAFNSVTSGWTAKEDYWKNETYIDYSDGGIKHGSALDTFYNGKTLEDLPKIDQLMLGNNTPTIPEGKTLYVSVKDYKIVKASDGDSVYTLSHPGYKIVIVRYFYEDSTTNPDTSEVTYTRNDVIRRLFVVSPDSASTSSSSNDNTNKLPFINTSDGTLVDGFDSTDVSEYGYLNVTAMRYVLGSAYRSANTWTQYPSNVSYYNITNNAFKTRQIDSTKFIEESIIALIDTIFKSSALIPQGSYDTVNLHETVEESYLSGTLRKSQPIQYINHVQKGLLMQNFAESQSSNSEEVIEGLSHVVEAMYNSLSRGLFMPKGLLTTQNVTDQICTLFAIAPMFEGGATHIVELQNRAHDVWQQYHTQSESDDNPFIYISDGTAVASDLRDILSSITDSADNAYNALISIVNYARKYAQDNQIGKKDSEGKYTGNRPEGTSWAFFLYDPVESTGSVEQILQKWDIITKTEFGLYAILATIKLNDEIAPTYAQGTKQFADNTWRSMNIFQYAVCIAIACYISFQAYEHPSVYKSWWVSKILTSVGDNGIYQVQTADGKTVNVDFKKLTMYLPGANIDEFISNSANFRLVKPLELSQTLRKGFVGDFNLIEALTQNYIDEFHVNYTDNVNYLELKGINNSPAAYDNFHRAAGALTVYLEQLSGSSDTKTYLAGIEFLPSGTLFGISDEWFINPNNSFIPPTLDRYGNPVIYLASIDTESGETGKYKNDTNAIDSNGNHHSFRIRLPVEVLNNDALPGEEWYNGKVLVDNNRIPINSYVPAYAIPNTVGLDINQYTMHKERNLSNNVLNIRSRWTTFNNDAEMPQENYGYFVPYPKSFWGRKTVDSFGWNRIVEPGYWAEPKIGYNVDELRWMSSNTTQITDRQVQGNTYMQYLSEQHPSRYVSSASHICGQTMPYASSFGAHDLSHFANKNCHGVSPVGANRFIHKVDNDVFKTVTRCLWRRNYFYGNNQLAGWTADAFGWTNVDTYSNTIHPFVYSKDSAVYGWDRSGTSPVQVDITQPALVTPAAVINAEATVGNYIPPDATANGTLELTTTVTYIDKDWRNGTLSFTLPATSLSVYDWSSETNTIVLGSSFDLITAVTNATASEAGNYTATRYTFNPYGRKGELLEENITVNLPSGTVTTYEIYQIIGEIVKGGSNSFTDKEPAMWPIFMDYYEDRLHNIVRDYDDSNPISNNLGDRKLGANINVPSVADLASVIRAGDESTLFANSTAPSTGTDDKQIYYYFYKYSQGVNIDSEESNVLLRAGDLYENVNIESEYDIYKWYDGMSLNGFTRVMNQNFFVGRTRIVDLKLVSGQFERDDDKRIAVDTETEEDLPDGAEYEYNTVYEGLTATIDGVEIKSASPEFYPVTLGEMSTDANGMTYEWLSYNKDPTNENNWTIAQNGYKSWGNNIYIQDGNGISLLNPVLLSLPYRGPVPEYLKETYMKDVNGDAPAGKNYGDYGGECWGGCKVKEGTAAGNFNLTNGLDAIVAGIHTLTHGSDSWGTDPGYSGQFSIASQSAFVTNASVGYKLLIPRFINDPVSPPTYYYYANSTNYDYGYTKLQDADYMYFGEDSQYYGEGNGNYYSYNTETKEFELSDLVIYSRVYGATSTNNWYGIYCNLSNNYNYLRIIPSYYFFNKFFGETNIATEYVDFNPLAFNQMAYATTTDLPNGKATWGTFENFASATDSPVMRIPCYNSKGEKNIMKFSKELTKDIIDGHGYAVYPYTDVKITYHQASGANAAKFDVTFKCMDLSSIKDVTGAKKNGKFKYSTQASVNAQEYGNLLPASLNKKRTSTTTDGTDTDNDGNFLPRIVEKTVTITDGDANDTNFYLFIRADNEGNLAKVSYNFDKLKSFVARTGSAIGGGDYDNVTYNDYYKYGSEATAPKIMLEYIEEINNKDYIINGSDAKIVAMKDMPWKMSDTYIGFAANDEGLSNPTKIYHNRAFDIISNSNRESDKYYMYNIMRAYDFNETIYEEGKTEADIDSEKTKVDETLKGLKLTNYFDTLGNKVATKYEYYGNIHRLINAINAVDMPRLYNDELAYNIMNSNRTVGADDDYITYNDTSATRYTYIDVYKMYFYDMAPLPMYSIKKTDNSGDDNTKSVLTYTNNGPQLSLLDTSSANNSALVAQFLPGYVNKFTVYEAKWCEALHPIMDRYYQFY